MHTHFQATPPPHNHMGTWRETGPVGLGKEPGCRSADRALPLHSHLPHPELVVSVPLWELINWGFGVPRATPITPLPSIVEGPKPARCLVCGCWIRGHG